MRPEKKQQLAQRRHWRVRRKICGTPQRPRMSVCFTNQHIYVQFIDDEAGRTLAAFSTRAKGLSGEGQPAANVAGAQIVGKAAAESALAKGITTVVLDRGDARFHRSVRKSKDGQPTVVNGKLATLADAARAAGLKF